MLVSISSQSNKPDIKSGRAILSTLQNSRNYAIWLYLLVTVIDVDDFVFVW